MKRWEIITREEWKFVKMRNRGLRTQFLEPAAQVARRGGRAWSWTVIREVQGELQLGGSLVDEALLGTARCRLLRGFGWGARLACPRRALTHEGVWPAIICGGGNPGTQAVMHGGVKLLLAGAQAAAHDFLEA
jgi:hypothetical protein